MSDPRERPLDIDPLYVNATFIDLLCDRLDREGQQSVAVIIRQLQDRIVTLEIALRDIAANGSDIIVQHCDYKYAYCIRCRMSQERAAGALNLP